jgi:ribonuclease Z
MTKLIILGTANAVPTAQQDNTHLVLVGEKRTVLVDTASNPITRLRQAGVDPVSVTDLILTHFHPDHVSGLSLYLLDIWLLHRTAPLKIYGLASTLERAAGMMDLFGWHEWPNFFPVEFCPVSADSQAEILRCDEFAISSVPVRHMIPTIGIRAEFLQSGKSMAYSCDTAPAPEVIELARGVDVLLHESTGAYVGHTSAAQAGEIARQAGAKSLLLIHYDEDDNDTSACLEQARESFGGPVALAKDFMEILF